MCGPPGCRCRQARVTGLSPVGPPWPDAEAAEPRGWCVAWCATTALAGAVPFSCVRGARRPSGVFRPVPGFVSSPFPPPCPVFPALCVAGRPVRVSLILARWYAIPCGLCVPRAWSGCPSGIPPVSLACACACALVATAPLPPPRVCVTRAPHAVPLVGPFHAVRAPPRVLPRSRALFGMLGRLGAARSRSPLAWLGVVCPPLGGPARPGGSGAGGAGGGGGGLCAVLPGGAAGGPRGAGGCPTWVLLSAFPGRATKRVSLTLLWSRRAWPPYCSG